MARDLESQLAAVERIAQVSTMTTPRSAYLVVWGADFLARVTTQLGLL